MEKVKGIFLQLRNFIKSIKFDYQQKDSNFYYPDYPQRGKVEVILDIYCWACKNGTVNIHYLLYGMDRQGDGIEIEEYLPFWEHLDILKDKLIAIKGADKIQKYTEN